ncbi:hypothetical protein, partial [Xanthomonas sacchari]
GWCLESPQGAINLASAAGDISNGDRLATFSDLLQKICRSGDAQNTRNTAESLSRPHFGKL